MILEVVSRRAAHPTVQGPMLERGARFHLDPVAYPKHAAMAERMLGTSAWKEVEESVSEPEVASSPHPDADLLPHQRAILERLKGRQHTP